MACIGTSGAGITPALDFTSVYSDKAACINADLLNGPETFWWVDGAASAVQPTFDIATAQILVAYTLGAIAIAYTFRLLRDMILNRR